MCNLNSKTMEKFNQNKIDQLFNEESKTNEEKTTFPAFENVWSKIEQKLEEKPDKKRIIPIWFPYGIAASLVIGLGVFYFYNHKEDPLPNSQGTIVQNNNQTENNSGDFDIQKIDSTFKRNLEDEIAVKDPEQKISVNIGEAPINGVQITSINGVSDISASNIPPPPPNFKAAASEVKRNDDIEGVVVTAYGIKREKKEIAYSTTTISSEKISSSKNSSVFQALQGRVAGVDIASANYDGNSDLEKNIKIRGAKSIDKNQPLVIVDGVPFSGEVLGKLDANKIESVKILKDASATALYGSKAANGVIIIDSKNLTKREKRKLEKSLKKTELYKQIKAEQNNEEYDAFVENQFELVKSQPLSTFSIDVDKASYTNVRRMITNNEKVDKNAVRIEEMINYFKYTYPQPNGNQPFSINTEYNVAPWNPNHKLLKIGLQGKEIPQNLLPPSNFVFLIDVSGSMSDYNKLPLLKSSFKVLLESLRPQDKVSIVVYAGSAGMVLAPTNGNEKEKIIEALDNLSAGGSTAGGAGIELAYKLAQENFIKEGNNRVILATDGDFNVGVSSTANLETLIEEKRKSGVYLTCLGFGMGNYKDNRLETLADKGNGNYAYIDTQEEADKFLGKEFAGNMFTIAKDVKIQIEFNPTLVKSYRLIGYENRKLRNEDFKNDKIDAGELGSGHTVTALYEIIPVGVDSVFLIENDQLKYSETQPNTNKNFGNEIATIKFRYKKPDEDQSKEIQQVVKNSSNKLGAASTDFRFASSVAWFGLVLRNSQLIPEPENLDEIIRLAKQGKGTDKEGYRTEFIGLVERYQNVNK